MRKKTPDLETVLKDALKNSGLSTYKLEEKTGVAQAVIYRFISGKRSITLPTASKIAEALGLELRPKR
ncbi:helix-turn-helix domain-containing protein [Planctomycetota bacterium]